MNNLWLQVGLFGTSFPNLESLPWADSPSKRAASHRLPSPYRRGFLLSSSLTRRRDAKNNLDVTGCSCRGKPLATGPNSFFRLTRLDALLHRKCRVSFLFFFFFHPPPWETVSKIWQIQTRQHLMPWLHLYAIKCSCFLSLSESACAGDWLVVLCCFYLIFNWYAPVAHTQALIANETKTCGDYAVIVYQIADIIPVRSLSEQLYMFRLEQFDCKFTSSAWGDECDHTPIFC